MKEILKNGYLSFFFSEFSLPSYALPKLKNFSLLSALKDCITE